MFGLGPIGGAIAALATAVVLSVTPPSGPIAGGNDVQVHGLNFAAGATIKFGTTAPTSPVVASACTITCTTAAGDSVYVDDVTVTNVASVDVNTLPACFDRTTPPAASLNPNTINCSGLWESSYSAMPIVGTASTGTSGSSNQVHATWFDPTTGAVVNGFTSWRFVAASLNGTDSAASTTTLIGSTGWSYACLINMAAFVPDIGAGQSYGNAPLWVDSSQDVGVTVSASGISAFQTNVGGSSIETPKVEVPLNAWIFVEARWTGALIQIRVNCGPWYSTAITTIWASLGATLWFGASGYNALSADKLFEVIAPISWTDVQADQLGAWVQARYALTGLGFATGTLSSTDPTTIAMSGLWYDYAGSSPWSGTASTGTSGTNALSTLGAAPGAGTALNGHGTASFNGTTQALQSADTSPTMIGPEAVTQPVGGGASIGPNLGWTAFHLAKFAVLAASSGEPANDAALLTTQGASVAIGVSSDLGARASQIDVIEQVGSFFNDTSGVAVGTGSYILVQERWTGRRLELRTCDGTIGEWQAVDAIPPRSADSAAMYVGANYTQAAHLNGTIAAHGVALRSFSTNTLDGIGAWAQNRYSLSLGFVSNANYSKSISENIGAPTDGKARAFVGSRAVGESIAKPTDALARALAGARSVSEAITKASDALARAFAGSRSVAESIAIPTDAKARAIVAARAIPESIAIPSDSPARAVVASRSVAESIAIPTDAVSRLYAAPRSISESIAKPTDALARAGAFLRSIAEAASAPSDAVARAIVAARSISESITIPSDAAARAVAAFRSIGESIAIPTDSATRAFAGSRSVAESIAIPTDAVSRVHANPRSISESIAIPSDSPSRTFAGARSVAEAIAAITDAATRATSAFRSVAENVGAPTDSPARMFAGSRSVAESIAIPTDSASRTRTAPRSISESITIPSDAVARAEVVARSIAESIAILSDAVDRLYAAPRSIAENVGAPTDSPAHAADAARSISENVQVPSDSLARAAAEARTIAESIALPSDAAARSLVGFRSIDENAAKPTDSVVGTKGSGSGAFTSNVSESIASSSDVVDRVAVMLRVIGESLVAPTDTIVRATSESRGIVEVVQAPSDSLVRYVVVVAAIGESLQAPTDSVVGSKNVTRSVSESIGTPIDSYARAFSSFRNVLETMAGCFDSVGEVHVVAVHPRARAGVVGVELVAARVIASASPRPGAPAGTTKLVSARLGVATAPPTSAPGKQAASSTKEPGRTVPGPKKR